MLFQLRREPSRVKAPAAFFTQRHHSGSDRNFIFQREDLEALPQQLRRLDHEFDSQGITEQAIWGLRSFSSVDESNQSRVAAGISAQRESQPSQTAQVAPQPRMCCGEFIRGHAAAIDKRSTTKSAQRQILRE